MNEEKCKSFLIKTGTVAAVLLIVLLFAKYLLGPLTPFIIAIFVAALLQPAVKWMVAHMKLKTGLASTVAVILVYVIAAGLVLLLIIGLLSAAIDWASGLPDMFNDIVRPWIIDTMDRLPGRLNRISPDLGSYAQELVPDMLTTISSAIMSFSVTLVSWASSVGSRLPGAMMAAVICVIATVFCTSDYENITSAIYARLPKKAQSILSQSKIAAWDILINFAKSYLLILFITFVQIAVGLLIIGMDHALFIAAIIALFDILPIVGSGMILLPWTLYKLLQGQLGKGIGLMILYLFVVISRQIIEPKVVGKRVGLHPLSTLVCMWLGLKVIGGIGIFALPIFVLIVKDLNQSGYIRELFRDDGMENSTQNPETEETL